MTVYTWPERHVRAKTVAFVLVAILACFGLFAAGHRLVNGSTALSYSHGALQQAEDVCLDEQLRIEGIVVMQRCARANVASLKKIQQQGGAVGKQAENALRSIEKLLAEPTPTPR